jgi:hypothetical protein
LKVKPPLGLTPLSSHSSLTKQMGRWHQPCFFSGSGSDTSSFGGWFCTEQAAAQSSCANPTGAAGAPKMILWQFGANSAGTFKASHNDRQKVRNHSAREAGEIERDWGDRNELRVRHERAEGCVRRRMADGRRILLPPSRVRSPRSVGQRSEAMRSTRAPLACAQKGETKSKRLRLIGNFLARPLSGKGG